MTRSMAMFAVLALGAGVFAGDPETGAGSDKGDGLHPRLKMETTLGDIVLELDAEKAPISTLNFVRYAEDKFYDGTIFHRVVRDSSIDVIQGGGITAEMDKKTEGVRSPIKNEWDNGLKNVRGTISMARMRAPDSATSQFFINTADNANLDRPMGGAAYAVFGKVVEGMETVDKIRNVPLSGHPKYAGGRQQTVPVEPVVVKSVRLVSKFDREKLEAQVKAADEAAAAEKKSANEAFTKKYEEAKSKGTTTASGLVIYDMVVGEGASPASTDTVELHCTGWLTDGTKFWSSHDGAGRPLTSSITGFVPGFTEGVGTMKVGGKRMLIIPSELGYGEQGRPPSIPPNATLVFEIDFLGIK